MKPNFALDLSHDGISLLHRGKGGWTLVGEVALDDPEMGAHLDALRRTAAQLESGGFTTKLVIPNSQILYTTVEAPGPDDIAREVQIRAGLDGLTPYAVGDLVFDWRAEGDKARVAVLARETMDEAETFAAEYKFNPVSFVARPESGQFSGEPFFGLSRAAPRLIAAGDKITPDASPVPRRPRAMELPAEKRVEAAEAPADPAPAAKPAAQPPEDWNAGDPLAALDQPETETEAPAAPPRRRKPRSKPEAGVVPPALAPFPPTPEETEPVPVTRPAPAPRETRAAVPPAPPGPEPVAEAAPVDGPDTDAAPAEPEVPPVAFSSRRISDPLAATDSAAATPAPAATAQPRPTPRVDIPSALADGPAPEASRRVELPPRPTTFGPSSPIERMRAGMADALAKPLPKSDGSPAPEPRPGLGARLAALLPKRAPATTAPEAPAGAEQPAKAAKPAKAGKPAKPARRNRKSEEEEARAREAEAMTVFGARRAQASRGRPRYLGLILTLALLLLMAAAALLSGFFFSDQDTALFNPGPAVETTAEVADDTLPSDGLPDVPAPTRAEAAPATGEVLSTEAAQARYAATGVWQRAPEALATPEATRLSGMELATLAPLSHAGGLGALPGASSAIGEATPAEGLAPPPPGTTFDLDANGLVRATPDGAVSPTGILVYAGKPPAVPPPRPALPESEASTEPISAPAETPTETVETAAADLPAAETAETAETETARAETIAATPAIRPAARPADLVAVLPAAVTDTAAIDEAVDDVIAEAFAEASEYAVPTSRLPNHRPSNFAKIVDAAQASASDGSVLVADAEPDSTPVAAPAIPTAANVASEATVANALNLREINLIGIYGTPNSRRALVRLSNGRYVKVKVGDKLDGGQVTSISGSRLTYQRGSRTYALDVLPLG